MTKGYIVQDKRKGKRRTESKKKYNKEGIGNEKIRGAKEGKGEVTQETGKGGKGEARITGEEKGIEKGKRGYNIYTFLKITDLEIKHCRIEGVCHEVLK